MVCALLGAAIGGGSAASAPAAADSWAPGPSSSHTHVAGVSVELSDGRVLLAAGGVNASVSTEGELLPADGTSAFIGAGTMTQGRLFGAATLLPGGDVLIAGGDKKANESTPVPATAELWSPGGGGSFTATGPMRVPRQVLTLTTLPNGFALAVGGSPDFGSRSGSKTAELYNPATDSWKLTGSMPSGRYGHTATLLPNCKVLIVGDAHTAVTYNYVTGTFSSAGGEGTSGFQRSYHTATLLANGKVLIAGGETRGKPPVAMNTASVYNPATRKFTPTKNHMSTPHSEGFAAELPDGRVIVGGGFSNEAHGTFTNAVDIYDPMTNTWSSTASLLPNSFAAQVEAQTLQDGDVSVTATGAGNASEVFTPGSLGSTVTPPAENCSDLFSLESAKPGSHGTITLRVGVPGAGNVMASAVVPVQSGVAKSFSYGSDSADPSHWGPVTLTISPDSQARKKLQTQGTLRVSLHVVFTPAHGSVVTRKTNVLAHW